MDTRLGLETAAAPGPSAPRAPAVPASAAVCWHVRLPGGARAARSARRAVSLALDVWDIGGEAAHDTLVVVSELVGNAAIHGQAEVSLLVAVLCDGPRAVVRVEAFDEGPVTDSLLAAALGRPDADVDAENGRGLALVRALADGRVVVVPGERRGKAVRAELDVPPGWRPPGA